MSLQPFDLRHSLGFLLDCLAQLIDARVEVVEKLQQSLPAPTGPGRQLQRLQLRPSFFAPQPSLAPTPSFMAMAWS